jgi:hypothetical protein
VTPQASHMMMMMIATNKGYCIIIKTNPKLRAKKEYNISSKKKVTFYPIHLSKQQSVHKNLFLLCLSW